MPPFTAVLGTKISKEAFNIDIETCEHCGGYVKVIACIEDPLVIEKILAHLKQQEAHASRAEPRELL